MPRVTKTTTKKLKASKRRVSRVSVPTEANGTVMRNRGNAKPQRVPGSAFICKFNQTKDWALQSWAINPGLDSMFNWLSKIATRFEMYRFMKLSFRYISRAQVLNTQGGLSMAIEYDPNDSPPTSDQEMLTMESCVVGSYLSPTLACSAKPQSLSLRQKNGLFVRASTIEATTDYKTVDLGKLYVATSDGTDGQIAGELWVDYEVDLFVQQTDAEVLNSLSVPAPISIAYNPDSGVDFHMGISPLSYIQSSASSALTSLVKSGVQSVFTSAFSGLLDIMARLAPWSSPSSYLSSRVGAIGDYERPSDYVWEFPHDWSGVLSFNTLNFLTFQTTSDWEDGGYNWAHCAHRLTPWVQGESDPEVSTISQLLLSDGSATIPFLNKYASTTAASRESGASLWSNWFVTLEGKEGVSPANMSVRKLVQMDTFPTVYSGIPNSTVAGVVRQTSHIASTSAWQPFAGVADSSGMYYSLSVAVPYVSFWTSLCQFEIKALGGSRLRIWQSFWPDDGRTLPFLIRGTGAGIANEMPHNPFLEYNPVTQPFEVYSTVGLANGDKTLATPNISFAETTLSGSGEQPAPPQSAPMRPRLFPQCTNSNSSVPLKERDDACSMVQQTLAPTARGADTSKGVPVRQGQVPYGR